MRELFNRNLSIVHPTLFLNFVIASRVVKGLAPTIINDLFPLRETNNYNLRHKLYFKMHRNETVRNGFKSIPYLGPKI